MKIPTKESEAKLIEKKSKFIAHVFPLNVEDEVAPILNKIKRKYKSVAHIPYAYRILKYEDGKRKSYERYSDDGEPNKTAGYPVLRMMHNKDLSNLLIVVVRVFGGIKLGMAGLMKAFTEVSELALENNKLIEKELKEEMIIKTNLEEYSNIEILLKKYKIEFQHSFDSDAVRITAFIPIDDEKLKEKIMRFIY